MISGCPSFTSIVFVHICLLIYSSSFTYKSHRIRSARIVSALQGRLHSSDYTAVMIVPTGIGASIGNNVSGYFDSIKHLNKYVVMLVTRYLLLSC